MRLLHVKVSATTSSYAACHLESTEGVAGASDILLWLDYSADADLSNGTRLISFHDADGEIGYITAASASAVNAFNSDIRLKEEIQNTSIEGLNIINALKVRDFKWNSKAKKNTQGKQEIGAWVADEVYEVYPKAVIGTPGQTKEDGSIEPIGLADSMFIAPMMKAIQELSAKVTALENA